MSKIQVTDKYRISSDIGGWTLDRKDDTGWTGAGGRYMTFKGAVSGLSVVMLRDSKATDVKQLARDAEEISKILGELMEIAGA